MPLPLKSAPVLVIARTPYTRAEDIANGAQPVLHGKRAGEFEGNPVEKIVVICDDGMTIDNLTLAPHINGECVVGARVSLTVELTHEQVAVTGRDGRPRVGQKNKMRVVDVEPVSAAK